MKVKKKAQDRKAEILAGSYPWEANTKAAELMYESGEIDSDEYEEILGEIESDKLDEELHGILESRRPNYACK